MTAQTDKEVEEILAAHLDQQKIHSEQPEQSVVEDDDDNDYDDDDDDDKDEDDAEGSMAAPPARARADYDYLIKLLLIGNSEHGEVLEVLHYEVGQKYEPHHDYFCLSFLLLQRTQKLSINLTHLSRMGRRWHQCMLYTYCSCVKALHQHRFYTITCHPKNIEHILWNRFDNYPRGPHWQAAFHDLLGQGILTSDGESWLIQRKTTALGFTTRTLRQAMGHWVNRTIKNHLWCILDKASNEKKSFSMIRRLPLIFSQFLSPISSSISIVNQVVVSKAVATGLSSNSAESVCGHGLPLAQTNKHFLRRKCKTYWQIFTGLAKVIYIYIYVKHIGI
ncbi:hypothetical protein CXB51_001598 [Gossypium anomalum]|uniref:Cytochrome P450 n=1 Tax=Gossypium anomalum TaxID=47600 RepID=A0A8J6DF06_9ROSI|nr:hypothetical protein CXB51_001598 [Gossypium anomalum]